LSNANLSDANLNNANLNNASLRDADLTGADLTETILLETFFSNVNITNVIGLETCVHRGPAPSTIELLKDRADCRSRFFVALAFRNALLTTFHLS
jgi:uncharacterized protein YjbI with pentapeptide repeats